MSKRLMIIGVMLLFSISTAPAQTPSPEALAVARSLISTMKLTDQYKALLPVILLSIKPALVQGRPEIERDYDAMAAQIGDAYAPYYSSMVDSAASLYASNFTVDELREIDAAGHEIVMLRFFAGLSVDEIASTLKISRATVKRDWATAKLWLRSRLLD